MESRNGKSHFCNCWKSKTYFIVSLCVVSRGLLFLSAWFRVCVSEFLRAGVCVCMPIREWQCRKHCGLSPQRNAQINNNTGNHLEQCDWIKDDPWTNCPYHLTAEPLAFNYTILRGKKNGPLLWIRHYKTSRPCFTHTHTYSQNLFQYFPTWPFSDQTWVYF